MIASAFPAAIACVARIYTLIATKYRTSKGGLPLLVRYFVCTKSKYFLILYRLAAVAAEFASVRTELKCLATRDEMIQKYNIGGQ